ncbi:MAG: SNF2 helicase associated domain-containing protein, partial [Spirochaetales bacterium]|nr:SNF2 helicase associated domain-containing protein [Candidatus Physcosoma equi]
MGWKERFSVTILQRGFDYFRKGRVRNLLQTGNAYSADVVGSETYFVQTVLQEGKVSGLKCNCPYAEDGHYCKHEAALLYQIQDTYGDDAFYQMAEPLTASLFSKTEKKPSASSPIPSPLPTPVKRDISFINPFRTKDDGKYHYFRIERLTSSLPIRGSVYVKAKRLVESGQIRLLKNTYNYYGDYREKEVYSGSFFFTLSDSPNSYHYSYSPVVEVLFNQQRILTLCCSNIDFSCHRSDIRSRNKGDQEELCVHKTAALILLQEILDRDNPGDATDKTGRTFMDAFRKKVTVTKKETQRKVEAKPVDIEPSLTEKTYYGLELSFRIGNEKLYVVKSISSLLAAWENEKPLSYGKDYTIDFSSVTLTPRAQKSLEFLSTYGKKPGYGASDNAISLSASALDNFYTVFKDQKVVLDRKIPLFFREESPSFTMKATECFIETDFTGILLEGSLPVGWRTSRYSYRIKGNTFLRSDISSLGPAKILYESADRSGFFSFTIGRRELDNFYQRVLPELRKYGTVDTSELKETNGYLKPEPQFTFFVDYVDHMVCATCSVTYDAKTYPLLPQKNKALEEERSSFMEDEVRDVLYQILEKTDGDTWYSSVEDESVYHFLTSGLSILSDYGTVMASENLKKLKMKPFPKVNARVETNSNLLELSFDAKGLSLRDIEDILASYRKKKIFHRFKDGSFVNLETENLDSLLALFEGLNISAKEFTDGKMHLPVYRALYLDALLCEQQEYQYEKGPNFRSLVRDFKSIKESDYEVPSSLKEVLRSYQKDGYQWMRVLHAHGLGGILADDMGLGKTLQVLTLLLALKEEGHGGTSLIVTPASLVYNWKSEAEKFTPSLKVGVVSGKQKERNDLIASAEKYDVLITSYDLLKRDIAEYSGIQFQLEIIDEAQFIKNHNTAAAKSVRVIESYNRFALTGTPIENRLLELWSIFEYLMPGFLYQHDFFRKNIEATIMKDSDRSIAAMLKKMVSPFILRRLKTDVLKDLPEKLEEVRYVELEGEQQRLYNVQVAHLKKTVEENKGKDDFQKDKLEILAELTKIRQICCDPSLLYEDYSGESSKREAAMDLIKSAIDGGHRILLFSQFTSMLSLLEKDLEADDIGYYKITGDTPKEKRLKMVDAFNSGTTPVFLISLKAGGTGLNLTGADVVIHYDPWWNLAVQNQATDRAHRIGQSKVVSVFKMIARNTLEERILELQEKKRNIADEIVSAESISLSSLTREELLE